MLTSRRVPPLARPVKYRKRKDAEEAAEPIYDANADQDFDIGNYEPDFDVGHFGDSDSGGGSFAVPEEPEQVILSFLSQVLSVSILISLCLALAASWERGPQLHCIVFPPLLRWRIRCRY